jgi:pentatricopeptide repeat protein
MIGSTERGLSFSNEELRQFNLALVEQIIPHLKMLKLEEELLKFTGDGWLLITNKTQKVEALCCLAVIMAKKFQEEMSERTSLAKEEIPALRLSICSGGDILVTLPDGRTDWVGDSARRAVRASGYCKPNEIIICEWVQGLISRDFETEIVDLENRRAEFQHKRMEERFTLYQLGELKKRAAVNSKVPGHYVYMLDATGRSSEAKEIVEEVTDELSGKAAEATAQIAKPEVHPENMEVEAAKTQAKEIIDQVLRSWNRLLASLSDYAFAKKIVEKMKMTKVVPNVVTYNILMNIAGDFKIAQELMKEMRDEGILPNVVTYSTLIKLASDFETARDLLKEMRDEGILPNVVTYNTLINLASDFETARELLKEMRDEGILPNVVTYSTLINLASNFETARDLLKEMRDEGILPNVVTYSTLINLASNFETARDLLKEMRDEGILPDVVTYNTLINLASNFETAQELLKEMRDEGILPNVVTYNTLINLASDFETAQEMLKEMRDEGIMPNVVTYSTLINLASDFETARELLKEMRDEGIMPNVVTYSTVLSKDLSEVGADQVVEWYKGEGFESDQPMKTAIANYRKGGRITEALRICLEWPYLDAARKVMREYKDETFQYLENKANEGDEICDPSFALGIAYLEWGEKDKAVLYLEKALTLEENNNNKEIIKQWLKLAKG